VRVGLLVSGHGFGHAVRSATVGRELLTRGHELVVRTDAPARLFPMEARLLPTQAWPFDMGVVQYDGLELDIAETRRRWIEFDAAFDQRADAEARELTDAGVEVALGDMPPLGFEAAARAGIPSIAMTNFGWDWIYAAWPEFDAPVRRVRSAYARAELLLRMDLHADGDDAFPAFRRIVDVPIVARPASAGAAAATRDSLGLPDDVRPVLLSFGGIDVSRLDLAALGRWERYVFLTPSSTTGSDLPPNVRPLPRAGVDYAALVAVCDAVVTKPGYGIVADCLANRAPVLYTDRGSFREYPVLADALERLGPARYVPSADVRRGWLGPHLDALLAQPRRWQPLRLDGAHTIADELARFVRDRSISGRPPAVAVGTVNA
jgi:UDP:flavonoid glycosyltransferase YjiC (YdhE family)